MIKKRLSRDIKNFNNKSEIKMKKTDLKKLALMGITGGVMLASQGISASEPTTGFSLHTTVQNGCGNKCGNTINSKGGGSSCGGRTQYKGQNNSNRKENNYGEKNHCGGKNHCSGRTTDDTGYNRNRSSGRPIAMNDDADEYPMTEEPENKINDNNNPNNWQKNSGKPVGYPKPSTSSENMNDDSTKTGAPGSQTGYNSRYRNQGSNRMIGMTDENPVKTQAAKGMKDSNADMKDIHGCAGAKNFEPENEEQFLKQLDAEGRRTYTGLNPEGKKLAQRLAKQYTDKNQAVKHAARQMSRQTGKTSDEVTK